MKVSIQIILVIRFILTLILLNNLINHTHLWLSANQITLYNVFVQIYKLNDKQCRSWSDGFLISSLSFLFLFLACPSLSSLLPLLSLFSLCLGDDTKWPTRVELSLNPNTISLPNYHTYPYKRTDKQLGSLQITASVLFDFFIKA